MSIRVGQSLGSGSLVPRKYAKIETQYIGNITHYGYFAKNKDGSTKFLGRIEVETVSGKEVRAEFFIDEGVFAP